MRTFSIERAASWIVIHRCIHFRGAAQAEAFRELARRGLWLSPDQKQQAGVAA